MIKYKILVNDKKLVGIINHSDSLIDDLEKKLGEYYDDINYFHIYKLYPNKNGYSISFYNDMEVDIDLYKI